MPTPIDANELIVSIVYSESNKLLIDADKKATVPSKFDTNL